MSCKSAQRLRRRLYVKHNGNVPNLSDVPNLERTNTQREIIIPKRRTGKLAPIEKHLGNFSKTSFVPKLTLTEDVKIMETTMTFLENAKVYFDDRNRDSNVTFDAETKGS